MAAARARAGLLDRAGQGQRDSKLLAILSEAAAQPELLAALAAHMSPPYPLPEPLDKEIPGYAKLTTSVLSGQPDATYYVQLPPEYDPHRRYPMIVSLHSLGHDPTMQIEWWAGEHDPKLRARAAGPGGTLRIYRHRAGLDRPAPDEI